MFTFVLSVTFFVNKKRELQYAGEASSCFNAPNEIGGGGGGGDNYLPVVSTFDSIVTHVSNGQYSLMCTPEILRHIVSHISHKFKVKMQSVFYQLTIQKTPTSITLIWKWRRLPCLDGLTNLPTKIVAEMIQYQVNRNITSSFLKCSGNKSLFVRMKNYLWWERRKEWEERERERERERDRVVYFKKIFFLGGGGGGGAEQTFLRQPTF